MIDCVLDIFDFHPDYGFVEKSPISDLEPPFDSWIHLVMNIEKLRRTPEEFRDIIHSLPVLDTVNLDRRSLCLCHTLLSILSHSYGGSHNCWLVIILVITDLNDYSIVKPSLYCVTLKYRFTWCLTAPALPCRDLWPSPGVRCQRGWVCHRWSFTPPCRSLTGPGKMRTILTSVWTM